MKKSDWKDTAELVGIAAIVASLIFVGLELRQSHQIAIAAAYQERATSVIDQYNSQIQSDAALIAVGTALNKEIQSPGFPEDYSGWFEEYTIEQLGFVQINALNALTAFDNIYFQYQSGFMSQESWNAFRYRLRRLFESPIVRWTFEDDPNWYRESYRRLCYELIAEIDVESR